MTSSAPTLNVFFDEAAYYFGELDDPLRGGTCAVQCGVCEV